MRTNTRLRTTQLDLELQVFNRKFYIDKCEYLNSNNTKFDTYLDEFCRAQVCRLKHFVYCGKPHGGWGNLNEVTAEEVVDHINGAAPVYHGSDRRDW